MKNEIPAKFGRDGGFREVLAFLGVALLEDEELVADEVPGEDEDGRDEGADIGPGLVGEAGWYGHDVDDEARDADVHEEADEADCQEVSEFFADVFAVFLGERPVLIPDEAIDDGREHREALEDAHHVAIRDVAEIDEEIEETEVDDGVGHADEAKLSELKEE